MERTYGLRSSPGAALWQFAIFIAIIGLAAFAGAGVGLFGGTFGILIAGAVLGLVCLALPLNQLMWVMLILVFMVVGQVIYFARIDRIIWAPYLLGALLFVRIPLEIVKPRILSAHLGGNKLTAFGAVVMMFFAVAVMSTAVNQAPMLQVFVSVKEYAFLWSVFLIISLGMVSGNFNERAWYFLLWLAPLQVPMVLYQRFVVATSRTSQSSWDSVVGLFGGNPEGGGASGAMAFFLIFCILLALSMWRSKLIRTPFLLLVVASGVLSISLAEVKAAIVALPVAILLLYRKDLLRRPAMALTMGLSGLAVSFLILVSYQTQFASERSAAGKSLQGYIEQMFERSVDTDFFAHRNPRLNRTTSLKYWYTENSLNEPFQLLMGNGIGATKVANLSVGSAARRHLYRLDASSATILLWETGIIGMSLVVIFFLLAANMARVVERDTRLPVQERAVAAAAVPTLLLLLAGLAYNTDFANVLPSQLLTMLLFGYSALHYRKTWIKPRVRP